MTTATVCTYVLVISLPRSVCDLFVSKIVLIKDSIPISTFPIYLISRSLPVSLCCQVLCVWHFQLFPARTPQWGDFCNSYFYHVHQFTVPIITTNFISLLINDLLYRFKKPLYAVHPLCFEMLFYFASCCETPVLISLLRNTSCFQNQQLI